MEAGDDVVALDVSSDGSRVLIGRRVSTDSEGNDYFDLYMHVGSSPNSVEVADTPNGVLYGGMTSDGGQVLFTTVDPLADDTDSSADLFRATIGSAATVTRVSTGESGAGDSDACDPAANSFNLQDWNVVPGGPTDCSVVALGGGDGVASEDGSAYFLSPEQLDGSGVAGAPNLFVARPGESPHFVATLESSANEPLKPGAVTFTGYAGTFSKPAGAALDRATGSFYVYDVGTQTFPGGPGGKVQKFTADGTPDESFAGDSVLSGADGPNSNFYVMGGGFPPFLPGVPTQIAVDNSGGPNSGDLYVTDLSGSVKRFSSDGNYELTIPVGPGVGSFSFITGVAVHPVTGDVYVSYLNGFTSESSIVVYDENGVPTGTSITRPGIILGIAVDSNGNVYAAGGGEVLKFDAGGSFIGTFDPGPSKGVAVDPGVVGDAGDDVVYVDRGDQVIPYTPGGAQVGSAVGSGIVSGSLSLATDAGSLVVSNPDAGNVAVFRTLIPSEPAYDNPLVIDSVRDSAGNAGDQFQVTPDGRYAVFATTLPVTGFDSAGHYELARYDSAGEALECVSCNPTKTAPSTDARLATNGLSITDDGRVFFTSGEPLVLRDTNQKLDAYEWSSGHIELISTGQSPFDSGLLSVTADGTDAFFFTREKLASNDENGNLMKLYTAREGGGFFVIPPTPPCAASDECHGPSSQAAPPVEL
jgi:hypothetical protein